MRRISIFTTFLVLLVISISFQNCSEQVDFSTNRSSSSVDEVRVSSDTEEVVSIEPNGAVVDVGFSESSIEDALPKTPIVPPVIDDEITDEVPVDDPPVVLKYDKIIEPFQPKEGPLEVTLLIDDSKSNAPYASKVIGGVRSLFDQLPKDVVRVKAFSLDQKNGIIKGDSSFVPQPVVLEGATDRRIETSKYVLNDNPLAEIKGADHTESQFELAKDGFIDKLQQHLNRTIEDQIDRAPRIQCETLMAISQQRQSADVRSLLIVVTDEDVQLSFDRKCLSKYVKDIHTVPQLSEKMINFSYDVKRTLEGGAVVWEERRQNFKYDEGYSCEGPGYAKLVQHIDTYSHYRMRPDSQSGCATVEPKIRNASRWTTEFHSFTGSEHSDDARSLPGASAMMQELLQEFGKAQFFVGVFGLMPEDSRANNDQESADRVRDFYRKNVPASNRHFQSLHDENYGAFIERVLNFKHNTETNRVSISDLLASLREGENIEIREVSVTDSSGNVVSKNTNFSRQGDEVIVNDAAVNLSLGGGIILDYIIKN